MALWLSCLLVLGMLAISTSSASAETSLIKDPNLEKVVRNSIGKRSGVITEEDMLKLKSIFAFKDEGITSLIGLEYAKNLQKLIVSKQEISSLEPIAGLEKLTFIDASNTKIMDLTPLKQVDKLQHLAIGNTHVADLSPLSKLENLTELFAASTDISDLSPLSKLQLTWIEVSDSKLTDISPLGMMNSSLRHIFISRNHIQDLAPIMNNSKVEHVYTEGNPLNRKSVAYMKTLSVQGIDVKYDDVVIPQITVQIDGKPLQFQDQDPQNWNGSTFVPMRGIFEALGAKIEWNQADRSVRGTKNNSSVWLQIGSTDALVNGKVVVLEVEPRIVNNTTMVPVRLISEALGATVTWDAEQQIVQIQTVSQGNARQGNPVAPQPASYDYRSQPRAAWAYQPKVDSSKVSSKGNTSFYPAVVQGDTVYYADLTAVYAINEANGNLIWSYPVEHINGLTLDGGILYFSDTKQHYALDTKTGSEIWTAKGYLSSGPFFINGTTAYFSEGGNVVALDALTGERLWAYTGESSLTGNAIVAYKDSVIIGESKGRIQVLNAKSGKEEWHLDFPPYLNYGNTFPSSPNQLLLSGKTLVVGTQDNFVNAIDMETHSIRWKKELTSTSSSLLVQNNAVVAVSGIFELVFTEWDLETGQERMKKQFDEYLDGGWNRLSVTDGMLILPVRTLHNDNFLLGVDRRTGDQKWLQRTTSFGNAPALTNGSIYMSDNMGNLSKWSGK
ncbi:stalk domain-containing protein [Paenibacillus sp. SI8]|uniref:stalk domain-containing protein n=1 Tax=unclassified Paenibacillus TaxID=185978 RepID=UPI003467C3A3